MEVRWSLHFREFANIQEAEIEIAPLICFVGDNNSGKSYVMSLLWGILTIGKEIFPQKPSESKSYKACEEWLRSNMRNSVKLDSSIQEMYLTWFNDLLAANKTWLLKRIFNHDMKIGAVEITRLTRKPMTLQWKTDAARYSVSSSYIRFPAKDPTLEYTKEELLRMNSYICWNILMYGIAAPLYTPLIKGRRMGEPVYMPASRTGFMLTYPTLVSTSVNNSFAAYREETDGTPHLTQPYIDFLQLIATQFDTSGKSTLPNYSGMVDFIEQDMVRGRVIARKNYVSDIKYIPESMNKEMPLHITSSVVTELSPILLLLKSGIKFKSIIIEEPEAHLHPALQRQMARLLVKLANHGFPVWTTTHSDTIIQHINNMIKLNNKDKDNKDKLLTEFNYQNDDIISPDNINMYQFSRGSENNRTRIEPLEHNDYGFVAPTFNNALENIVKEVYAFQKDGE